MVRSAFTPCFSGRSALLVFWILRPPSSTSQAQPEPNVVLAASAQAGGPTVGQFISQRLPLRGFVVEQQKDEARLVVPTRNGVVWVGWVAAEGGAR